MSTIICGSLQCDRRIKGNPCRVSKLLLRKDLGHLAILSVVEAVGSLAEASLIEKLLGLQPEELARGLSEDVALALLTYERQTRYYARRIKVPMRPIR